jgi:serine phosphatase RsbU (regulator of sigma subunit)
VSAGSSLDPWELADELSAPACVLGTEGTLLFANRALRETFAPGDALLADALRSIAAATADEPPLVRRLTDRSGKQRWYRFEARHSVTGAGDRRVVVTALDIDEASRAADDLRFLADVGETMVENLDLTSRLHRFVNAVVPRLADWATVNLLADDGAIETLAIAHRDPALADVIERLRGPFYGNPDTAEGTPSALRSGRSRLLTDVDEKFLHAHIRPETVDDVLALGADSSFIVPLVAHGRIYGTLAAMRTQRQWPFLQSELWLIEELARRAAVAIANAKLFERNATVADAFQHASLPSKLPRLPAAAFSAFYAPGRSEAMVGGDWYDAFVLGDGRVVVSIGDVAGSGLRAAVLMGSVRQLIRGAAQLQSDPLEILDATDRALRGEHSDAIVTAFVGVVDTVARRITYASAGHPPPLLRAPGGATGELASVGLPLGLRTARGTASASVAYPPGSLLVLYTDGLIESTRDILEGERRLRDAVALEAVANSSDIARSLHDAVLHPGAASDDVAILAVSLR